VNLRKDHYHIATLVAESTSYAPRHASHCGFSLAVAGLTHDTFGRGLAYSKRRDYFGRCIAHTVVACVLWQLCRVLLTCAHLPSLACSNTECGVIVGLANGSACAPPFSRCARGQTADLKVTC